MFTKLISLIVIPIVIFLSITFTKNSTISASGTINTLNSKTQNLSATTKDKPLIIEKPQRLVIPKLGINTQIEYVGLDKDKKMDVPKNADNVAWYKLGYKIGDKGNAAIAGHYDRSTGAPAIFYNLTKLVPGDSITVIGEDNKQLKFKVIEKQNYPVSDFPISTIFGSSDKIRLNLITCQGTFNQNTQSYSNRTVIYTELDSTK